MDQQFFVGGSVSNSSSKGFRSLNKRVLILAIVTVALVLIALTTLLIPKSSNKSKNVADTFAKYLVEGKADKSYKLLDGVAKKYETTETWKAKVAKVSGTITTKNPKLSTTTEIKPMGDDKASASAYKYDYLLDGKDGKYALSIIITKDNPSLINSFTNNRYSQ